MSEQSLQLIQMIKQRLRATSRRRSLTELVFGAVLALGVLAGAWLIAISIEAGFWLDASVRSVLLWMFLGLSALFLIWYVVLPLLRMLGIVPGESEEALARDIGASYPQISDRMINLLHLAEGRSSRAPAGFVDHAVRSLSRHIEAVPFEKMGTFDRAIKISRIASLPVIGLIVFWIAAPGVFTGASHRLLSPGEEFQKPAPFQIQVTPGSVELIRGDSLRLEVALAGSDLPIQLNILTRNENEEKVTTEVLTENDSGSFRKTFVNVRRSFSYRIEAAGVETPWFDVTIVERPIIRSLQVALEYPRYSRIPSQRLEPNVGDVQALPGTRVMLEVAVGGRDIVEAHVLHDNGTLDTLSLDAGAAFGAFTLDREGFYQIQLTDIKGVTNSNPIKYSLKLLQDAFPTIVLLEPPPLSELNESLAASLRSRITDDFGFSRVQLFYRLAESRFGETTSSFETVLLPMDSRSDLDQEITFAWLISQHTSLDLVPGDVVEYYLQVWDNDSFAGYKSSQSAVQLLRLPSLAEQYQELERKEDNAQDEMEDLLRETQQVKDQFEELRDELRNKLESDWEDQRQLEQLQEKQAELESRVEDLSQSFEEMTSQMEENNLASDETLQMYQEMQQVLEEINSPELMDALNELQQAMQELNLQQMQESLSNFEMNEEQYQQRLERTLELFKQLRVQQDLEEVARRAEELAQEQEKLQEETGKLAEEDPADSEEAKDSNRQQEGENQEEINREGENQEGQNQENQHQEGENQEGQNQEGESQDPDEGNPEQNPSKEETPRNEALAGQQERSKEEMEELERQLEQILERMQEIQSAPREDMQNLNEQVQDQQIPEQMQQNAEQLRNQEYDQAQQQQQQMQQQLQQMQQQLQQMQQSMQGSQMQLNISGLRRALSDILTLSQLQEDLREAISTLAADSPVMRQYAQQQVELGEGLSVVSDSLQQLARQIPQMSREVQQHAGDALREMTSAVEAMTERVANRASGHQKESMMHLNELALLLSDLLNEMMNSQGSGGGGMSMQQMIQQLQNAAGQQQKLNQQIQQMLNEMQGNRLSQDMQERLRQMAAQQEQIRSEIKQLSRNRELRGQVMGDLNRIAQQMEETIRELQQNRPGRRTMERQQQILTRMLDATKSLQERGREKRREGQIGEEQFRESPGALTPSEQADQLRRALLEALESGYSPDYEELIKRYFELLQERSLEER